MTATVQGDCWANPAQLAETKRTKATHARIEPPLSADRCQVTLRSEGSLRCPARRRREMPGAYRPRGPFTTRKAAKLQPNCVLRRHLLQAPIVAFLRRRVRMRLQ